MKHLREKKSKLTAWALKTLRRWMIIISLLHAARWMTTKHLSESNSSSSPETSSGFSQFSSSLKVFWTLDESCTSWLRLCLRSKTLWMSRICFGCSDTSETTTTIHPRFYGDEFRGKTWRSVNARDWESLSRATKQTLLLIAARSGERMSHCFSLFLFQTLFKWKQHRTAIKLVVYRRASVCLPCAVMFALSRDFYKKNNS